MFLDQAMTQADYDAYLVFITRTAPPRGIPTTLADTAEYEMVVRELALAMIGCHWPYAYAFLDLPWPRPLPTLAQVTLAYPMFDSLTYEIVTYPPSIG